MIAVSPHSTRRPLRSGSWGGIVDAWNKLELREQRERAAICRAQGHEWRQTDLGCRLCVRCCQWEGE